MNKGSGDNEKRAPAGARPSLLSDRFRDALGVLRDHQFLVGRDHIDQDAGLVGREFRHARSAEGTVVYLAVEIDAEEIQPGQGTFTDRRGILADADKYAGTYGNSHTGAASADGYPGSYT